jgi:hypothetical protein
MTQRVLPWMFAILAVGAGAARADTIPCNHRYVTSKVREFFNYVQNDRKTGFKAVALDGAKEVGQDKLPEHPALRRFCEANLKVEGGEAVLVYITVTSREGYKKDRAEDVQACWENKKYGEPAVVGASSGCGPLKPVKR